MSIEQFRNALVDNGYQPTEIKRGQFVVDCMVIKKSFFDNKVAVRFKDGSCFLSVDGKYLMNIEKETV